MFAGGTVRTGIDLGTGSVKLVRGVGKSRLERVTHAGIEDWDPPGSGDDSARAAGGLRRLLSRMHLRKGSLGRIAVAVGGEEASVREVLMPPLAEAEFRRALPFEARKHLLIDSMASPIIGGQVLGPAPREDVDDSYAVPQGSPGRSQAQGLALAPGPAPVGPEDRQTQAQAQGSKPGQEAGGQVRAILAAVPSSLRNFPLQALAQANLEPDVIGLVSLANLNALLACAPKTSDTADRSLALLDLGAHAASLHISGRDGGFLSRSVGPGVPAVRDPAAIAAYLDTICEPIRETLTFYRGRMRRDVGALYVGGGGALMRGIVERIRGEIGIPVSVIDPLAGLIRTSEAPRFVTACGLCRFWDRADV